VCAPCRRCCCAKYILIRCTVREENLSALTIPAFEISLEWNQDAVPYFTEDQYRALCAKFSAEDFSIPDGDALSSPDQYKLSCVSVQKVK